MKSRLLIVDNEPRQLAMIERVAKGVGFQDAEIVGVASAADVESHLTHSFEIAVVDLVLSPAEDGADYPEDGLSLISSIHRVQPQCVIIALTRSQDPDAGVRAFIAGARDFVCLRWNFINGEQLLAQRLRLWRGVVLGQDKALVHA